MNINCLNNFVFFFYKLKTRESLTGWYYSVEGLDLLEEDNVSKGGQFNLILNYCY
jgi:hypothetical protein